MSISCFTDRKNLWTMKLISNFITLLCFKWKSTQLNNDVSDTSTKESKYYPEFERTEIPNLNGKVVVITGCTSGMGLVAAKCTARKGAKAVIMLNRLSERATIAEDIVKSQVSKDSTTTIPTIVETIPCDLQDFASVQEAIRIIKSKYDTIDVLCNNAGVMNLDDIATKDGYDVQMQTNHLSHFLLTKELFPLIQKSNDGRIVNHSSLARNGKPLQSQYFEKNGGNLGGNAGKFERYHQSKLANSCFTLALANKINDAKINNVKVVCAAPGFAATNLFNPSKNQNDNNTNNISWGVRILFLLLTQSAEDGTMPLLTAMYSPKSVLLNGDLYEPKNWNGISGKVHKVLQYDINSLDMNQQNMLWTKSEQACGSKFIIQ